jgi:hypothetical protein
LLSHLGLSDADDEAIRLVEILDGRSFLQKLGVAGHVKVNPGQLSHPSAELGVGTHGDRALDHYDLG